MPSSDRSSSDPAYAERDRELDLRWWAAGNYLTVAQIYLKSSPLLQPAHPGPAALRPADRRARRAPPTGACRPGAAHRRVPLTRGPGDGGALGALEGYLLSGRNGLYATYEAFARVSVSMLIQHTKWLQHATALPWRAPVASLNVLLTIRTGSATRSSTACSPPAPTWCSPPRLPPRGARAAAQPDRPGALPRPREHGTALAEHCHALLARHHDYVREHLHDMPEVRDWTWTP